MKLYMSDLICKTLKNCCIEVPVYQKNILTKTRDRAVHGRYMQSHSRLTTNRNIEGITLSWCFLFNSSQNFNIRFSMQNVPLAVIVHGSNNCLSIQFSDLDSPGCFKCERLRQHDSTQYLINCHDNDIQEISACWNFLSEIIFPR